MTAAEAHIARTVVGIIGWLSLLISTPKEFIFINIYSILNSYGSLSFQLS